MLLNRSTLRAVFSLVAAFLMVAAGYAQEMRIAVVTVYDSLTTTASIQAHVDRIANLNYNAIAIHARFRGDSLYFPNKTNSTYPNNEPRTSAAGSLDVLQEFITRGQAKGLKVFAYVNCFLITDGQNTDPRPTHILNTNADWVTYAWNNGTPTRQTTTHDAEGKWVDPGIPAVRNHITNICRDITVNYNIDGIFIDRIRYPQSHWQRVNKDFGYHPTAISRYRTQYGGSGVPHPNDTNWIKFRQDQVSAMVTEVYNAVAALKPQVIVAAYPIGRFSDAINFNYVNWPAWMTANKVDAVVPMIYATTSSDFQTRVTEHRSKYNGARLLGTAVHGFLSGIDVNGQITIARNSGMVGISPFRHGTMESLGYNNTLTQRFTAKSNWPAMSWKPSPEFIVDNTSAGFTASANWWTTSATPGYYGSNYHTRGTAAVSDQASWSFNLPTSGSYRVDARWSAGSNRAAAAPYSVVHSAGTTSVAVNQRVNGGTWNSLGTYNFNSGTAVRVRLSCWTTAGFYVVADAVRLVKQ